MVIVVEKVERRWRVVHPQHPVHQDFARGSDARGMAAAVARSCHREGGQDVVVRVEAFQTGVEALRISASSRS